MGEERDTSELTKRGTRLEQEGLQYLLVDAPSLFLTLTEG